jgi:hypothetical protein
MERRLMKIFTTLLILLIITSLGVFPATTVADKSGQDKAMDFMKKVLPINTSKYTIHLRIDTAPNGKALFNYNITNLQYELSRGESKLYVDFTIENDILTSCCIYPREEQVITKKQYTNLLEAVTDFLETYQIYTKTDSNNLITILKNVDLNKNSTITNENTKLIIITAFHPSMERNIITFRWVQVINGAEYPSFELTFDKDKSLFLSVDDSRTLYTIGDTSINISKEQAMDIALENLKQYSYEMSNGSIVSDLKASKANVVAKLWVWPPIDYEFKPYWDVRTYLDEVYPGSVFCIATFIWANNGEIISYGNSGPFDSSDYVGYETPATLPNSTLLIIVLTTIVTTISVVSIIGLVIKKKHKYLNSAKFRYHTQ